MPELAPIMPPITHLNKPHYEAGKKGELILQKCKQCSKVIFPISNWCPYCFSFEWEWSKMSGRGKITTWTIYHQSFDPHWDKDIPYNVIQVELEEGPRLLSNLLGAKNEDIYIGMPVEATFESISDEYAIVKFKPAPGAVPPRS